MKEWEPVIGLEIHVELNTKSKLFSSAKNYFGSEPNSNISSVCTGLPGALPTLNKEAVRKAIFLGCALNAKVATTFSFDRKSYFYPDNPRNFQITQYYFPIIREGFIKVFLDDKEKIFHIQQAHLEDDAGMLKHFSGFTGVDYNRAGVPLIEIVSEPCMFSSKEAVAYAMGIKNLLEYINISDCNMEEGSLRFDANVSVRPKGSSELRNKIEIKNMNSFSFMEMALDSEIRRQINEYENYPNEDINKAIPQATYRWDSEKKKTILMRLKENAEDYRYFPEPDLPVFSLSLEYIEDIRKKLPEMPYDKFHRYLKLGLSKDISQILVVDKNLASFFDKAAKECKNLKMLSNWITIEFIGRLKDLKKTFSESGLKPSSVASLVNLIVDNVITGKIAKTLADMMVKSPEKGPEIILNENPNMTPLSNQNELLSIIEKVINNNPDSVVDYKAGKTRALGFLIGQVMKITQGKASPQVVNELLLKSLES